MASVRVFSTAPTFPTVRDCLGFAAGAGNGVILAVDADDAGAVDPDSPDWTRLRLVYREDLAPLDVQVLRARDATAAFRETRDGFLGRIAETDTATTAPLRAHLTTTRAIVVVTFAPDADEDALEAAAWFTRIFTEKYGGLLQADGEGFYDRDNALVLPLPAQ